MARVLRMPSEEDLPPGTVRDFVEALFMLYKEAHRPTLRTISTRAERKDVAVSAETIRQMLQGKRVPIHWQTVDGIVLALCDISGNDPRTVIDRDWDVSRRELVEDRWHKALDDPGRLRRPVQAIGSYQVIQSRGDPGPWADKPLSADPDPWL